MLAAGRACMADAPKPPAALLSRGDNAVDGRVAAQGAGQPRSVLLTTDAVGGVWRYSIELGRALASEGVRVVLAAMGPRPDLGQLAEAAAIPGLDLVETGLALDWLAVAPAQLREAARWLSRFAREAGVETVHLHTPALAAHAGWPVPVVAVAHSCVGTWWRVVRGDALPPDLAWRAEAVAQGLGAADAVIAPSHSFASLLATQYRVERPVDVVWNGRRPLGVRATGEAVLTAGRLWDPGKNVQLIDAAAAILGVEVMAAGPLRGPHGAGIDLPHLHCVGRLDEAGMAAQYRAASIFVSMARYEPFGLAVLEAAQAGCALVLSAIPTHRELWNGAAVFVDPHDARALAAAIRDCMQTPRRRAALGSLARRRAARFRPETMAAATWQIHRSRCTAPPALHAL